MSDTRIGIVSVPTATVIGFNSQFPEKVCMLRPAKKHDGKLVLPGGRIKLGHPGGAGKQSAVRCGMDEFHEEVGGDGAKLINPTIFAIATDLTRDVRDITWGKFQHELSPHEHRDHPIEACYGCPDTILLGEIQGLPAPNDGEARSAHWIDVRNPPPPDNFGAGMDVILAVYRHFLDTGIAPPAWALSDFAMLRVYIGRNGIIDYTALSERLMNQ